MLVRPVSVAEDHTLVAMQPACHMLSENACVPSWALLALRRLTLKASSLCTLSWWQPFATKAACSHHQSPW